MPCVPLPVPSPVGAACPLAVVPQNLGVRCTCPWDSGDLGKARVPLAALSLSPSPRAVERHVAGTPSLPPRGFPSRMGLHPLPTDTTALFVGTWGALT